MDKQKPLTDAEKNCALRELYRALRQAEYDTGKSYLDTVTRGEIEQCLRAKA